MKKTVEGYFSAEAALILPMVLSVILLIVYLLFFQYNRCLMEQDMGILALRGAVMQAEDNGVRAQQLSKMAEEMNVGKYLAWEMGEVHLTVGKGKVIVERLGKIKSPFMQEGQGEVWWSTGAKYEDQIISPVTVIRTYRRLVESGKKSKTGEGGKINVTNRIY